MNHADGNVRGQVRRLLAQHKVASDAQLTQAIADLSADDEPVRNAALDWLGQAAVNEARRSEVSRALEPLIIQSVQGPLLKALETWGTADNGLAIAQNLDGNVFVVGNQLKLLGKLRDPRTLPFLAARITRFAHEGTEARAALKQFGKIAEPEVVKLLASTDRNVRIEACRLLGDVGTRKIGIPAIQAAVQAQANDRQFAAVANTSVNRINGRAGL
jgi:HEAT repeat protein